MRVRSFRSAVLCSLFLVAPVHAATVNITKGSGMLDRGTGFVPFDGTQTVEPGTRIVVSQDSEAMLNYDAECPITIEPGFVITVLEMSPCKGSKVTTGALPALPAAAAAAAGTAAPAAAAAGAAAAGGISTGAVVGGVAVAGGVGIVAATAGKDKKDKDKDKPASP